MAEIIRGNFEENLVLVGKNARVQRSHDLVRDIRENNIAEKDVEFLDVYSKYFNMQSKKVTMTLQEEIEFGEMDASLDELLGTNKKNVIKLFIRTRKESQQKKSHLKLVHSV